MKFTRAVSDDDITDQFRASVVVLRDSGFDAIELHLGHNYMF
jgi:2,4-dienoyl-CoA reductase-like NADH-dependent reductase (Old Yellow Enzyme family)